jgi:hypothetical protein
MLPHRAVRLRPTLCAGRASLPKAWCLAQARQPHYYKIVPSVEGEVLSSNPLRAFFNDLRTTQNAMDVD